MMMFNKDLKIIFFKHRDLSNNSRKACLRSGFMLTNIKIQNQFIYIWSNKPLLQVNKDEFYNSLENNKKLSNFEEIESFINDNKCAEMNKKVLFF
jgi:hypothetical protein